MSQQAAQLSPEAKAKERLNLRRQMATQRKIELAMNRLIQDMENLVGEETKIAQSGMEKHQIKNLLTVALETPSGEVVKKYILYQVGRDVGGKNWRHQDFGKALVKKIDNLREKEAKRITDEVTRDLGPAGAKEAAGTAEELIDETWILLIRAYLGQLNRYFYYCKEDAHDRQRQTG